MQSFKKYVLQDGLNLYYIPTQKFKTTTVTIFINRQLSKEDATRNALLPYVLRRGCKSFPNSLLIAEYMEKLYGATFDCGINKKGENQMIYFSFDIIDEQYIVEEESLVDKIIMFAKEVIFNPIIEHGAFKKEYVEQEKEKLKDVINGLVNNKVSYAVERCFQEMCKSEAFSIYELGNIEDLEQINERNLYEYYMSAIYSSPIDIFVVGNMEEKKVVDLVSNAFHVELSENIVYPITEVVDKVDSQNKVEEKMDVAQGKLSLGFRTKVTPRDKDYYSLVVYNGILGGGPHSKL
ncbi:MAG: insulinase family protein, partial [Clostridia bacterium]